MCLYAGASAAETPKKSTDANLFGHVVDRETHEHLPYATVAVTGTAFGATTDASGHYFLKNLPNGIFTIEASEKPARRRADARSPCAGLRRAGEKGDARTGTDPRTEFRGGAERHFDGRSGRLGQPLGHAAARSPCAGERAGRRAVRENERFVSGAGAFVPARRAGRGRLSELRLRAGAHQRTRRPLFADSRRFASGLFGPDGRLRTGADSGQHDRAGRGAARRRFGAVRFVGHRRHDQRHYQGTFAQFGAAGAYADLARRQQLL